MTEKYRQPGENGFGWGLNVYNDKAGDGNMGTLQFNGSLAYQIYVGAKSMLAMGLQAGMAQRSIQFNKLYWGTQYDPTSSTGYNTALPPDKAIIGQNGSFMTLDMGAGMIYTYKKNERYMRGNDQQEFTIGASMFHVNQPKWSFTSGGEKLYMRMVVHGHAAFGISETNLAVMPGFVIMRQGSNQEIFLGSMFRYMLREDSKYTGYIKGSSISAGGFYRDKDALVATALFEFSSYGLGISYDFNISGLKTVSSGRGGLEITFRYLNPAPFLYSQASFGK
jgi:type IX secretion system PorP/SprF family membrane protein